MFGWRKRNEGFEWRQYVRTTILARRRRRRELIDNARAAAVFGVKEAGRHSASAAATGAHSFAHGLGIFIVSLLGALERLLVWTREILRDGGTRAAALLFAGLSRSALALVPAVSAVASRAATGLEPVFAFFRAPAIRLPLTFIGCVSGFSALYRFWLRGLDGQTIAAGAVAALALALSHGPAFGMAGRVPFRIKISDYVERAGNSLVLFPGLDRLSPRGASGLMLALLVGVLAGTTWLASGREPVGLARLGAPITSTAKIEGRAVALTGDRLRMADATIELDGIEAPEHSQVCSGPDGRWRCGKTAKEALARVVRHQRVSCEIKGARDAHTKIGRCTAKGADIAAELVADGLVFAATGPFPRYAGLERAAKHAGAGVWSGSGERPSAFRAKRWEEAKRMAPEGCPIKGRITSSGLRTYVLPWSPSYDSLRIVAARGERWFCSEEDARAAGWRRDARS